MPNVNGSTSARICMVAAALQVGRRMLKKRYPHIHRVIKDRSTLGRSRGVISKSHEGVIHKDVKPANVLVDSATGRVRLTGFGIASGLPSEHNQPSLQSSSLERSRTWHQSRLEE